MQESMGTYNVCYAMCEGVPTCMYATLQECYPDYTGIMLPVEYM